MAATAEPLDASREDAFRRFVWEQTLGFMRARGDALVPKSPYDPFPRMTLPDAKTQFERAGGKLVEPSKSSTNDRLLEQAVAKTFRMMLGGGPSCCPCSSAATCNDGLFCNGPETCASGNCATGTPACVDGDPCTIDACTENTDTCSFPPVPPPPAVAGLGLGRVAPASAVAHLAWSAVPGASAYNIYRTTFSSLAGLACFQTGVTGTSQNDDGAVPVKAFYFLVSSLACGESGLGDGHSNTRPPAPGCP
jgi:hypothetical protein